MANEVNIVIKSTDKSKKGFKSARKGMKDLGKSAKSTSKSVDKASKSASKSSKKMEKLGGSSQKTSKNVRKAGEASSNSSKKMGKLGEASKGADKGFRKLGEAAKFAGTAMAGFAALKVVGIVKSWSDAAIDAEETYSKAATVFGSNFKSIEQFADGAAQAVGLSQQAALDATATYGNMFNQLGMGGDVAADMSKEMVTLASDFASFHNADITDVIEAQTAAFRGEYDALQRFVPTINAASIEQKAMAMTGKTAAKQLTAQEKAAAAYAFMIENAGHATGDFEKTSDSMANTARREAAELENTSTAVGAKLAPLLSKANTLKNKLAITILNKVIPAIDKMSAWWKKNGDTIKEAVKGIANSLMPALKAVAAIFTNVVIPAVMMFLRVFAKIAANEKLVKSIGAAIGIVLVPAFVLWAASAAAAAVATLAAMSPLVLIGAAVAALAALIIYNWDTIKAVTVAVWNAIGAAFSAVWDFIKSVFTAAFDFIIKRFTENVATLIGFWDGLKSAVTAVWDAISAAATFVLNLITSYINIQVEGWKAIWNGFLTVITGIWNFIRDKAAAALKSIQQHVFNKINIIKNIFRGVSRTVRATWNNIVASIRNAMTRAYNSVVNMVNRIKRSIRSAASSIKNLGTSAVRKTVGWIPGIPGKATGGVSSGGDTVVGENGPELVSLQPGQRVKSNSTSRVESSRSNSGGFNSGGSAGGGGGVGGGSLVINVHGSILSERDLTKIVMEALQNGGYQGVM